LAYFPFSLKSRKIGKPLNSLFVIECSKDISVRATVPLQGQCHEIFDFRFFHESLSPKPLNIPLGSFRSFLKICLDIRSSRWHRWQREKNLQSEKF
jgi:hypothetical protein